MKKYIDFHIHSKISRVIGDSIGWFSTENTLSQIYNQNVKAISFTDHDIFDFEFYLDVNKTIEQLNLDIVVFPGVEITIKRKNGKKGHIIVIFDNLISLEKINELQYIIHENKNDYGTNIDKFFDSIKNYKYIAIPHIGKSDYLKYEDIKNHIDKFKYVEVKKSANNLNLYKRFCKESNTNIPFIYFSDTHNWDKNNYFHPNTFIEIDEKLTFDNIFKNIKIEE